MAAVLRAIHALSPVPLLYLFKMSFQCLRNRVFTLEKMLSPAVCESLGSRLGTIWSQ